MVYMWPRPLPPGYIQRRLMKAMEGIIVSYDGTVRNSNRHLVQLSYGEDGMDGAFMEFQQLPGIKPSNSAFKRRFYFDCSDQRCEIMNNSIVKS